MIITISRQFGAGGSEVARRVAEALDWRLVDNDLVDRVAERAGLPPEEVAQRAGRPERPPIIHGLGQQVRRARELGSYSSPNRLRRFRNPRRRAWCD